MKPGDRVRNRVNGRRGTVEWVSGFGTLCNVVWDDESRSAVKVKMLELAACPKIDDCWKVKIVLDKGFDAEGLYSIVIAEVCKKCKKEEGMKISDLLKRTQKLPSPIEFEWPGLEQWADGVFDAQVQSPEQVQDYIKQLKSRVAEQSHAICQLRDAYNCLINWIRDLELD